MFILLFTISQLASYSLIPQRPQSRGTGAAFLHVPQTGSSQKRMAAAGVLCMVLFEQTLPHQRGIARSSFLCRATLPAAPWAGRDPGNLVSTALPCKSMWSCIFSTTRFAVLLATSLSVPVPLLLGMAWTGPYPVELEKPWHSLKVYCRMEMPWMCLTLSVVEQKRWQSCPGRWQKSLLARGLSVSVFWKSLICITSDCSRLVTWNICRPFRRITNSTHAYQY